MNDHPSKIPNDKNKKRFRTLRPQLEQLDPRLCFSIDLPEPIAAFPSTETTAEISLPVDSNTDIQNELDTDSSRLHIKEFIDDTYLNESDDLDATSDFDVGSWIESNEDDEMYEEDLAFGFVTSALSGPAEAGRVNSGDALPEVSFEGAFTEDTVPEVTFKVWENSPIRLEVSPSELSGGRLILPSPVPNSPPPNSSIPNNSSLPLIQTVAVLSVQPRGTSSDIVTRRDISSLVGSQNAALSDNISAAPNQLAESVLESQPATEQKQSRVASKDLKTNLPHRKQPSTDTPQLDAENSSLPLVMQVAAIDIERATTREQVAANTRLVSTADLPSLQQVSLVGLVSLGNSPLVQRIAPLRPSGLRVIPAEQVGVPLTGVFEPVRSTDSPDAADAKESTLSENTYRLLLAGLIAIPTSTRGKKVLRWFQRDKKQNE
jgi:hypothetical protein